MKKQSWWERFEHTKPGTRVMGILLYDDADLVEFALALLAIAYGAWLLLPMDVFEMDTPVYAQMAKLAPEYVWGNLFLALGVIQMAAWLLGRHLARRILSLVGFFFWILLAFMFLFGDVRSTGVPTYCTVAFLSALCFLHNGGTRR